MNGATMRVDGLREMEQAMDELTKAAGRGVLRRTLLRGGQPLADLMSSLAPVDEGDLSASIAVSTRLDRRQAGVHRKMFRDDKAAVEAFVGPSYNLGGGGRHGHLQEFGTEHHAPQPFARPAWDQDKGAMLDRISAELRIEIDKAVARARRKTARQLSMARR